MQAVKWVDHFDLMSFRMQNLGWEGMGGEAAQAHYLQHLGVAHDGAEAVMSMQPRLAAAAADLTGLHADLMTWVEYAETTGYKVADDFSSVTDLTPSTGQVAQARQKLAQEHYINISDALRVWQSHLQTVAGWQREGAEAVRNVTFGDGVPVHQGDQGNHVQMGTHESGSPQFQLGGAPIPGGGVQMVDNHVNGDGTVKYTPGSHPPVVINEHGGKTPVPADPRDHNGSTKDIVDGVGKIAIGIGTEAGGVVTAPATGGASLLATIPGGALPIYDGLDDLARLTNMGRLPDAPPVVGQDGPG
jgi:hypothetical protein